MRVLVTGHRGYIGVEAVPMLREAGHSVVGLDTGLYDECDFLAPPDPVDTLPVRDFRDVGPQHLEGLDAVIHLAALSNDPLGDLDPSLTLDINERGTLAFARAAKQAGVGRFLFASSCSLYGASEGLLDETAAFNPVTPYGHSKIHVEQGLSELADADFCPTYFRNATAYGVSRRLRCDIVVNNLVGYALTTGQVLLKSDGRAWRPLVHIRDIVGAMIAALGASTELVHDQAFNVGRTEENYEIRDVATLVADIVGDCEVQFAEGASADIRNYRVDFGKIAATLPGFEPQWTVPRGIQELADAYRRANLTRDEFLGPRYTRLRTLRGLLEEGRLDPALRWV